MLATCLVLRTQDKQVTQSEECHLHITSGKNNWKNTQGCTKQPTATAIREIKHELQTMAWVRHKNIL